MSTCSVLNPFAAAWLSPVDATRQPDAWGESMDWMTIVAVVVFWLVLQIAILPRLGVGT
jgi:hypothetical protein